MNERYIVASAEDVATGAKVEVATLKNATVISLWNSTQIKRALISTDPDRIKCDFLADIIVRGIRSLEAEQQVLGARADERDRVTVRLVGDYEHDLDNLGS